MKTGYLLVALLSMILVTSCISDSDRCGPGQTYVTDVADGSKYYCLDEGDASTSECVPQAGGLCETCFYEGGECDALEADFCYSAQETGAEGYCTFQDCLAEPSKCPTGFTCCDFRFAPQSFCLLDADYQTSGLCN